MRCVDREYGVSDRGRYVRALERTGDTPPRHSLCPTSLRAPQYVPSSVNARACLTGPHPPTSSGSVFVLKTDSKSLLNPTAKILRRCVGRCDRSVLIGLP